MKRAAFLFLGLLAFSAVRADTDADDLYDDNDDWGLSGCGGTGMAGGWTKVNLQDVSQFQNVTTLAYTAAREYLASNADLIKSKSLTCYNGDDDDSGLDFDINFACKQVVAGTNYKIGFTVDCDDSDDYNGQSVPLEALIFVPLPGQGSISVNVTKRAVQCSTFDATKASCFFGSYSLDCDATNPVVSGTNASTTIKCEVQNRTSTTVTTAFTFYCPISVDTATRAISASCDLSKVPADLKSNITAILEQWKATPRSGNFFDDSDDILDDITDDKDDKDDDNDDRRRRFARLF